MVRLMIVKRVKETSCDGTVAEEGADEVLGQFSLDVDLGDPVGEPLSCLRFPASGSLFCSKVDVCHRDVRK